MTGTASAGRRRRLALWAAGTIALLLCLPLTAGLVFLRGRPLPVPQSRTLFSGVVYKRSVHTSPRLFLLHVVRIDLRSPGISLLVTPGQPGEALPLTARTTSEFLEDYGLQLAINGDGFAPWHSNSLADYYPHSGDPVAPNGTAASRGILYHQAELPTLYISQDNHAQFDVLEFALYNAISGDRYLVREGIPVAELPNDDVAPRTAIGLDPTGNTLFLVVVDGRQPFYSLGLTLAELAQIMAGLGVDTAINLDGGGSTTLVMQGPAGQAEVLNSPVDNYIPGRERAVGNHLGIFAEP